MAAEAAILDWGAILKMFRFFTTWHQALMDSAYPETPTGQILQFIYKNYVIISI